MALVPHKITALAESDAQGTDGKNIVAGAVVSLYDTEGNAVTLFDDENGSNGSTAKQTDATGQVVVYVTAGEYDEEVNGSNKRRVAIGGRSVTSYATTAELEATRPNKTGQRAENRERANAQYTLAAEGYTALAGDVVAANGRVWALVISESLETDNFTSLADVFERGEKCRASSNLTINVPTDSVALQAPFDFIVPNGYLIDVLIESGHSLISGLDIRSGDYSNFSLKSQDPVVTISPSFLMVSNQDLDAGVPRSDKIGFLGVSAKMPVWGIDLDVSGVNMSTGIELDHRSSITILPGCGVSNTSDGGVGGVNLRVTTGSYCHGFQSKFTGGNSANVSVRTSSTTSLSEANLSGSSSIALDVSRGAVAYAKDADASNAGEHGVYCRRAWVSCQGIDVSGAGTNGIWARLGSRVAAQGAIFDDSSNDVKTEEGSMVDVSGATKNLSPLVAAESVNVPSFNRQTGDGIVTNNDFSESSGTLTEDDFVRVTSGDLVTIPSLTYETIFSSSGGVVFGGSVYGPDVGLRITLGGKVVLEDIGRSRGEDSGGSNYAVISIPRCSSNSSVLIEAFNRGGASFDFGYRVYHE